MTIPPSIRPVPTRGLPYMPQIAHFTLTRLALNTAYRMIYPFLSIFATGLGVDLATISLVITGRSLAGVFSPFLAPVADRKGRRTGMLLGLGIFTFGMALVSVWRSLPAFFLALALTLFGINIFLPAMQAYLGDRIPYHQRGLPFALTELSWSLAFILGVPFTGFLITHLGWWAPFPLLTTLGLAAMLVTVIIVPKDTPSTSHNGSSLFSSLKPVFKSPLSLAALAMGLAVVCANETVNLVFGVWIESSFGLKIAALGAASAVIGFSELGGEIFSASLVDRLGKERSIILGLVLNIVSTLALPWLGSSLWGALAGLFFFYLTFEFTIVSILPFMTEIQPEARATLMAVNIAAFALGRMLGTLAARSTYNGSLLWNCLAAAALDLLALAALWGVQRIRKKTY